LQAAARVRDKILNDNFLKMAKTQVEVGQGIEGAESAFHALPHSDQDSGGKGDLEASGRFNCFESSGSPFLWSHPREVLNILQHHAHGGVMIPASFQFLF